MRLSGKAIGAEAHFNRGNMLSAHKQFERALVSYDAAIKAKSDYAEAYSNRGLALAGLEQWHAALASFDRATLNCANSPSAPESNSPPKVPPPPFISGAVAATAGLAEAALASSAHVSTASGGLDRRRLLVLMISPVNFPYVRGEIAARVYVWFL